MLEGIALRNELGRHVGMIVDADVVALQQPRQLGALERLAIDLDRRIVGAQHLLPHRRQLIIAIDKHGLHSASLLSYGMNCYNSETGIL